MGQGRGCPPATPSPEPPHPGTAGVFCYMGRTVRRKYFSPKNRFQKVTFKNTAVKNIFPLIFTLTITLKNGTFSHAMPKFRRYHIRKKFFPGKFLTEKPFYKKISVRFLP